MESITFGTNVYDLEKGDELELAFFVTPSNEDSEGSIKSRIEIENQLFDKDKIEINYPHIYKQMVLKSAEAKVFKSNLNIIPKELPISWEPEMKFRKVYWKWDMKYR